MNKEIEFRAWDKRSKQIIDDYFKITPEGNLVYKYKGYECDYIPMQYTGLKDINKQKLYFDYVVKVWHYREDVYDIFSIETLDDLIYLYTEINEYGGKFEILGCIHENPELLSETTDIN